MFLYRKTHAQRQYSCTVYMLVAVLSRTWLREEVESIHPASYGIRESDLTQASQKSDSPHHHRLGP